MFHVLFLCTGNSARSILGEVLLNAMGGGKFRGYSAGAMPAGKVNPNTLALLNRLGYSTQGLRSKSWDEFAVPGAPQMDFVFTVCDSAAGQACPVWIGHPITAHWGIPDPAAAAGTGDEIERAFRDAFYLMKRRIELFTSLPVESLDRMTTKKKLEEIGAASA
jgi:protein-tyrosine-phosphatase